MNALHTKHSNIFHLSVVIMSNMTMSLTVAGIVVGVLIIILLYCLNRFMKMRRRHHLTRRTTTDRQDSYERLRLRLSERQALLSGYTGSSILKSRKYLLIAPRI